MLTADGVRVGVGVLGLVLVIEELREAVGRGLPDGVWESEGGDSVRVSVPRPVLENVPVPVGVRVVRVHDMDELCETVRVLLGVRL